MRALVPGILAVAVSALLLTGCSTGSETAATASASSAPVAASPSASAAPTISSVLLELGSGDFAQSGTIAPYTQEWGTATYNGSKLQVYQFASEADRAKFVDSISAYGIEESQLVTVGLVVVASMDPDKTGEIQAKLAG